MTMLKAVMFDMDGVIIDSEPVYLAACKKFLEINGINVTDPQLHLLAGQSIPHQGAIIQKWWPTSISYEALIEKMRAYFQDFSLDYKRVLNPGIVELFDYIHNQGLTLCICSSSSFDNINNMIAHCALECYIDHVISGEQFENSKPDPQIYLYAMQKCGCTPNECIAIEDSDVGIAAGKSAGMPVIAKRDNRFGYSQHSADYYVDNLIEVKPIIIQMCN